MRFRLPSALLPCCVLALAACGPEEPAPPASPAPVTTTTSPPTSAEAFLPPANPHAGKQPVLATLTEPVGR
ncbi:hypothetical protein [Amycolatopsis anabasis]|uniref:hypothetical protein n=1 Tax=Amycolatopsis anabasis TaxID=1840409 RepID=UPI00131B3D2D|nr:hypothetical protein [Amycolatopsis anabasis]